MKINNLHRPAVFLTAISASLFCVCVVSTASAQVKTEQKVTSSQSKNNNEQTITVTAKTDTKDKDGKYKIHIIKDKNGKKTVFDTVVSSNSGFEGKDLEDVMENVNVRMKDVGKNMKDVEFYINSLDDSLNSDSSGHHKYILKFDDRSCCPEAHFRDFPHSFNYNFEMPDVPELPEGFEHEFFDQGSRGPRIITTTNRGESLSDVLGDIPMSRVKSYKIIDKKGGKRIVIDLEDGPGLSGGENVIYINGRQHMARPPRGHQKDMKVIIRSGDDEGGSEEPGSPAPPSEPKKSQSDTPKI